VVELLPVEGPKMVLSLWKGCNAGVANGEVQNDLMDALPTS